MKTLADFKRALTIGSRWVTFHNRYNNSMGEREVVALKSNAVGFKNPQTGNISWLDFPKASNFRVNELGSAEIYCSQTGTVLLTYTKSN